MCIFTGRYSKGKWIKSVQVFRISTIKITRIKFQDKQKYFGTNDAMGQISSGDNHNGNENIKSLSNIVKMG